MSLPWLVAIGAETVASAPAPSVVASALGVDPAWAALAGALVLAGRAPVRRRATAVTVLRATAPGFLAFVLVLGVVVRAVVDKGLAGALGRVLPDGTGLTALLGIAAPAALIPAVVALWGSLVVLGD